MKLWTVALAGGAIACVMLTIGVVYYEPSPERQLAPVPEQQPVPEERGAVTPPRKRARPAIKVGNTVRIKSKQAEAQTAELTRALHEAAVPEARRAHFEKLLSNPEITFVGWALTVVESKPDDPVSSIRVSAIPRMHMSGKSLWSKSCTFEIYQFDGTTLTLIETKENGNPGFANVRAFVP